MSAKDARFNTPYKTSGVCEMQTICPSFRVGEETETIEILFLVFTYE